MLNFHSEEAYIFEVLKSMVLNALLLQGREVEEQCEKIRSISRKKMKEVLEISQNEKLSDHILDFESAREAGIILVEYAFSEED